MNDFTASNGRTIEVGDDRYVIRDQYNLNALAKFDYLDGDDVQALREFFQAEADERLGRWRWPENPDYVVYPTANSDAVEVSNQRGGISGLLHRDGAQIDGTRVGTVFHDAARAYFDAHPEPKPEWHDAKPWETWVVTLSGIEQAVTLDEDLEFRDFRRPTQNSWCSIADELITAGRRIWPERES